MQVIFLYVTSKGYNTSEHRIVTNFPRTQVSLKKGFNPFPANCSYYSNFDGEMWYISEIWKFFLFLPDFFDFLKCYITVHGTRPSPRVAGHLQDQFPCIIVCNMTVKNSNTKNVKNSGRISQPYFTQCERSKRYVIYFNKSDCSLFSLWTAF